MRKMNFGFNSLMSDFIKEMNNDLNNSFYWYLGYTTALTDGYQKPNTVAFQYPDAFKNTNELCAAWMDFVADIYEEDFDEDMMEDTMDFFNKGLIEKLIHIETLETRISNMAGYAGVEVEFGQDSDGYLTACVIGICK